MTDQQALANEIVVKARLHPNSLEWETIYSYEQVVRGRPESLVITWHHTHGPTDWTVDFEADKDQLTITVLDGDFEDSRQHRHVHGEVTIPRDPTDSPDHSFQKAAEAAVAIVTAKMCKPAQE